MGPSGCGKSTLLYMLGALEPPTSGEVTINGTNPYALNERDQASVRGTTLGFVFQDHLLLPQLSALDNVLAPTLVARDNGHDAARSRAIDLLKAVGLDARMVGRGQRVGVVGLQIVWRRHGRGGVGGMPPVVGFGAGNAVRVGYLGGNGKV